MASKKYMIMGKIQELKEKKAALETKAEGLCSLCSDSVFMFDGVESIKIDRLVQSTAELAGLIEDYAAVKRQIRKLEENEL